jgi:hypothetical protein
VQDEVALDQTVERSKEGQAVTHPKRSETAQYANMDTPAWQPTLKCNYYSYPTAHK